MKEVLKSIQLNLEVVSKILEMAILRKKEPNQKLIILFEETKRFSQSLQGCYDFFKTNSFTDEQIKSQIIAEVSGFYYMVNKRVKRETPPFVSGGFTGSVQRKPMGKEFCGEWNQEQIFCRHKTGLELKTFNISDYLKSTPPVKIATKKTKTDMKRETVEKGVELLHKIDSINGEIKELNSPENSCYTPIQCFKGDIKMKDERKMLQDLVLKHLESRKKMYEQQLEKLK